MGSDSERLLSNVLLALPDHAVAVCDGAGAITAWNAGAEALTGVSADEAVGHDLEWLAGPDRSATTAALLKKARRGCVRREAWRLRADGSPYWCVSTLFAVTDDDGHEVAIAEAFHDETAGHHALLEQSQVHLMSVAAQSVGTVAASQDLDLRITWVSSPPLTRPALVREDLIGRLEDEFLPPDIAAFVAGHKRRVIETGEPGRFDVTIDGDDGRRVFDNSVSALRAADGSIIGVVTVGVDVTDRRAAEELLRAGEARLARAEAIARIGSWERDFVAGRSTWSDGLLALYETTAEEVAAAAEPFYERVHPQDLSRVRTAIDRAVERGGSFTVEHRIILPGGHVRFIRSLGEVMADDEGHPVWMAGTAQDITDAQQAEEALRRAARSLSESSADLERVRGASRATGEDLHRVLTRRQLEVLALLAEGLSNQEIAVRLFVSEGTVKWHVRHVLRALGVTTRAQAAISYLNSADR